MDNEKDFIIVNSLVYKIDELDAFEISGSKDLLISFDAIELLNSIYYTYKSNDNISYQFLIDSKRTSIYFNNKKLKIKNLINILSDKNKKLFLYKKLSFTQALYYWPYKIIKENYIDNNNVHLGETVSRQSNNYIKITDKDNFIFYKKLRLFKINDKDEDETIKIFNIEIHLSFNDQSLLIIS